jgi:hypothetical protein
LLLPPIGTKVGEDLINSHGAYLADSKWTTTTKTKTNLRNFNNKLLKLFAMPSEDNKDKITLYLGKNNIDLWSSPADYNASGDVIHTAEMSGYKYPDSNGALKS